MNKLVFAAVSTIMTFSIFAAPYVTNVVAKQRYPWGIVDISCDVKGIEESREIGFSIEAVLPDSGEVKKASEVRFRGAGNTNTDGLVAAKDGNYRFVWNANADIGSAHYTNIVVRIGIYKIPKKVQLWEDGPYWAEMNVGANEPWESGYYFWWGDTVGYKRENDNWVASDGSNLNFSFNKNSISTDLYISTLKSEGWITSDGILTSEYDAAQIHWGGNWRMPTKQDIDNLNSKCDWTPTSLNGVNGYVVKGRGEYSSNSIFLPYAGTADNTSNPDVGLSAGYWSSEPHPNYLSGQVASWFITISSNGPNDSYRNRWNGQSIRPVQGSTK
jgi:hypothetical protein